VSSKRTKSAKKENVGILQQVGISLDKFRTRFNDRGPSPNEDYPIDTTLFDIDPLTFWHKIETTLTYQDDQEGGWAKALLRLLIGYTGLCWAFLTEFLPGDTKHFHILQSYPEHTDLDSLQPINSGLAGWVHSKLEPLPLASIKTDENLSFVFHQGDPLKKATCFYGWPLLYNQSPRGSLILAGSNNETLAAEKKNFLDCFSQRLSAHFHQERLVSRVIELSRLDAQTGLPHRSYFIERLERLAMVTSVKKIGLTLSLLNVSGLGCFAATYGQEEAKNLLRSLAQQLLQNSGPEWELGHISYGLFALAAPSSERADLDNTILLFQKRLSDWPIQTRTGRASFLFHHSQVEYPVEETKPEVFLEQALANLARSE
jgi:GGDEF domain-containing protein